MYKPNPLVKILYFKSFKNPIKKPLKIRGLNLLYIIDNIINFFSFFLRQSSIYQNTSTVLVGHNFFAGSNFNLNLWRNRKKRTCRSTTLNGHNSQTVFNTISNSAISRQQTIFNYGSKFF